MLTINEMIFDWDEQKNQSNIIKHGIKFETAALVFNDDYRIEIFDEAHSTIEENRYITIGQIKGYIIVAVVYTYRQNIIRIISARLATNKEKEEYNNAAYY